MVSALQAGGMFDLPIGSAKHLADPGRSNMAPAS